jgi:hypothetical protein
LRWARASSRVGLRATHVPHRATFPAGVGSCSAVRFGIEQYRQLSLGARPRDAERWLANGRSLTCSPLRWSWRYSSLEGTHVRGEHQGSE